MTAFPRTSPPLPSPRPLAGALRALAHAFVYAAVRAAYRLTVRGLDRIPARGAALVVANHVSYVDALILGGLCRRRIRFVMDHRIHDHPLLRPFFQLAGAIPIASRKDDPERLAEAMRTIDEALASGELVALFPEGKLTRHGELEPFRAGVEQIVARRPVPVVPVALRGLWGSWFSWEAGKPFIGRPRLTQRRRVEVVVGESLAPAEVTADGLAVRIGHLRGDRA
jgi:1-acyl-sn-glycerol-3-phosphate acyltransferase